MKITIFSDGGARGNPGPAGVGAIIDFDSQEHKISKFIGKATNNQAEYQAVIEAMKWLLEYKKSHIKNEDLEIEFFLDSQLVVEQLNQNYKLKNEGLKPLFWQIRELIIQLGGKVVFSFIPREKNKEADRLVNQAIDRK